MPGDFVEDFLKGNFGPPVPLPPRAASVQHHPWNVKGTLPVLRGDRVLTEPTVAPGAELLQRYGLSQSTGDMLQPLY